MGPGVDFSDEVTPNGTVHPGAVAPTLHAPSPCPRPPGRPALTLAMAMPGRDALLSTKIGVQPRRSRSVDRARLRALLDGAPEARLVLVSAPAGFGKSTLLAAWLERADVRSAWLSLDPRDEDVVRFTRYLEAAVAQLSGGTNEPVMRDPSGPFDAELALASVIDQVVDAVADAARQPGRPRARRLSRHRGAGHPSARRLPHRAVAPACSPGDRHTIRSAPAARTPARPRGAPGDPGRGPALLDGRSRRAAAFRLDRARAGDVAELAERTEGWAAALRLAAISLSGRP